MVKERYLKYFLARTDTAIKFYGGESTNCTEMLSLLPPESVTFNKTSIFSTFSRSKSAAGETITATVSLT